MLAKSGSLAATFDTLRTLVALPSVSHTSTEAIARLVTDRLASAGAEVALLGPAPDRTNVVARFGPSRGDRAGLTLSGHMDVVPAGSGWRYPAFEVTEAEGRLYGRGTADMKGFLACVLTVLDGLKPEGLTAPVAVVFTFDEETGTEGARWLAEHPPESPLPTATLIGEPTELRPVTAHKGHLKVGVEVRGVSAHSGYPHLGTSAIEPVGRLIEALTALRLELEDERLPSSSRFPSVPFPALNIGTIEGGSAVNVVPDRCRLSIGLRLLPGMDSDGAYQRIADTVHRALEGTEHTVTHEGVSPALLTPESAEIVAVAQRLVAGPGDTDTGSGGYAADAGRADTGSVAYATDAGWLVDLGLECLVMGPGSIEVAHKPDEFVTPEQLAGCLDQLNGLIRHFCLEGSG